MASPRDAREDEQEFARQLHLTKEAIRELIRRLIQADEVDPHLIALAFAGVTGELGAAVAVGGGGDLETLLGNLADIVQRAGREHNGWLETVLAPAAGSA